jgi:hypothetical protein
MTIDGDAQEDQTPSKAGWYARTHDNGQKPECYWDGQVWQPTYKRVVQRFPLARPLHISQPPSIPTEHTDTASPPVNNERFAMPDLPPVADERQQQPPQTWAIRAAVKRRKFITAFVAGGIILVMGIVLAVSHGGSSPYSQGVAWEASQEHAGAVVDFGGLSIGYAYNSTAYKALTGWCQENQPAAEPGSWTGGCVDGYLNLHPGDIPGV